jgi:hypothetical protein
MIMVFLPGQSGNPKGYRRAISIVRGLCGSMSLDGLHWSPFAVSKHNPLKVI